MKTGQRVVCITEGTLVVSEHGLGVEQNGIVVHKNSLSAENSDDLFYAFIFTWAKKYDSAAIYEERIKIQFTQTI